MAKCFGQKVGSDCINRGGGRGGGGVSYTRLRELLLEKTEQLGMDPSVFGMHSLCRWCHCCSEGWCGPSLIQEAWPLEVTICQGGYVKDALETRLLVTKQLGI